MKKPYYCYKWYWDALAIRKGFNSDKQRKMIYTELRKRRDAQSKNGVISNGLFNRTNKIQ